MLFAFSWGALGVVGALVVPLLFKNLDSKHVAGVLAAQLFIWVSLLSLLCALLAVLCTLWAHLQKKQALLSLIHLRQAPSFLWGVAALGVSLAMLLGIIPSIQLGQDRALWHALGSVLYVVMWVLSGALLIEDAKRCFHTKLA